jgi:hypothetical protein
MEKDTLYNILLQLSPEDLKSMCLTNDFNIFINGYFPSKYSLKFCPEVKLILICNVNH